MGVLEAIFVGVQGVKITIASNSASQQLICHFMQQLA
jgi:hypothetical protein